MVAGQDNKTPASRLQKVPLILSRTRGISHHHALHWASDRIAERINFPDEVTGIALSFPGSPPIRGNGDDTNQNPTTAKPATLVDGYISLRVPD